VLGLERSYRTYRDLLTGPRLFAMFLLRSVHDITNADKGLQISMLLDAARQGFCPAQGVAQRVIESYDLPVADYLTEAEARTWLNKAVASGLPLESCEMGQLTPPEFETQRAIFHHNSGYNQFYSPIAKPEKVELIQEEDVDKLRWQSPVDKYKNTVLHQLASYGDVEQITDLLDRGFPGINERNTLGETALYKACLSGHAEVVLLLCQKGADASLAASDRRITCLHWMLNFPVAYLRQIVSAMLAAGADLDAALVGRGSLINYHFPLRWPAGTPLHWAVAASSPTTVKALLSNGADSNIRNGQDPYKADENVRQLHSHGTAEQGEFSETPETCLGLTAVDLAVANHDWRTLLEFSSYQRDMNPHLLTVDEEGYSPFHRLSQNRIGNTVTGLRFWYPAFMGDTVTRRNNLRRTVRALKMMGGDINQLTSSPLKSGLSGAQGGLSPLMIAVTKSDHEAVDVLCDEGANVNLQNTCGRTALTLMLDLNVAGSSPPGSISSIVRSLVDRGAEVNYQSPDGVTPLLCASSSGDLAAVEILAENGADLSSSAGLLAMAHMIVGMRHVKNMDHSFMSIDASEQRELELAALIENHIAPAAMANPLLVGDKGKTLVHCCANAALFACVKVLVDAGASVSAIEDSGTPTYVGGYQISDGSKIHGTPLDVVVQTEKLFETKRSDRLSQASTCYPLFIATQLTHLSLQKSTTFLTSSKAFASS
jgi:ankyrin repeat protein